MIEPVDAIEQAGFSCAVGPNDRKNFSPINANAYPIERLETPKTEVEIFDSELYSFLVLHLLPLR